MARADSAQSDVVSRYRTIVADPPWQQDAGSAFGGRGKDTRAARGGTHTNTSSMVLAYPTLTVGQIAALPVEAMAEPDAHLYLWATNRYVESAYSVARAWGFQPVSLLTWCKKPRGLGLGGAFVQTTEFVLFSRRGREIKTARSDTSWWQFKRPHDGASPVHSRKPDGFLDVVEQVSPGPYLELFARRARFGWDYYGDQSLGTARMPDAA